MGQNEPKLLVRYFYKSLTCPDVSNNWSLKNLENRFSCIFLVLIWTNTFRFVDFFPNDK